MPSTWNFAGDDARTAFTAFVFQVSTASGATLTCLCVVADATDSDARAATAMTPTRTSNAVIG